MTLILVGLLCFVFLTGMSFLFVASDNILDVGDENWYNNKANSKNQ
jgi:hypothetical protein